MRLPKARIEGAGDWANVKSSGEGISNSHHIYAAHIERLIFAAHYCPSFKLIHNLSGGTGAE
jgi:hypothetical protein